ncbi:ninja-family protein AFP3 isoform X2 [Jatropha curcas]|nr:ninja-family protein AFP3 isoform X2 [Jatropha curcas]
MQNNGHAEDLLKGLLLQEKLKEKTQLNTDQERKINEKINLGLSLGGIYCDNSYEKPLLSRSSSVIGVLNPKKDNKQFESFLSLARSCSVPTKIEQKQSKPTSMALPRTEIDTAEGLFIRQRNRKGVNKREKSPDREPMPSSPSKVAAWAAASAAKSPALCRALAQIKRQVSLKPSRKLEAQESPITEGGTTHLQSSPAEEYIETRAMPWTNANGKSMDTSETKLENPPKKMKLLNDGFEDHGMDVMKQMPTVTTVGDGPNGRKVEGFLYKYSEGQVNIVCICHGSFFSPEEFVRHAGCEDVANPMKRITVSSSFSF